MSLIQEKEKISLVIFNLISDVNMIVSYPYSSDQFANWTKTIIRMYPNVTEDVIAKITDNFLSGKETFDKEIGIVNYTSKINSYMGKPDNY